MCISCDDSRGCVYVRRGWAFICEQVQTWPFMFLWSLYISGTEWLNITWLLRALLIATHVHRHSPMMPLLTCALGAQWIYSTRSLWYVSVATVLLRWPLTCDRTEVCWLLSCKHTQQRTFQAKLLMDIIDLFLWTLRLLFSGCIPCCWSMTWYMCASSCLHSNAVKMWGKIPAHLCDCQTSSRCFAPVCLSLFLLCFSWNISKQDSVSINIGLVFTF